MIPEKLRQVLQHEGVVAIVTLGEDGPHAVNTWNSYLQLTEDERLLIPVGGMIRTEANLEKNHDILITLGTREVDGFRGPGTGFLISGTGAVMASGSSFDRVKAQFPWVRAALEVSNLKATQTL